MPAPGQLPFSGIFLLARISLCISSGQGVKRYLRLFSVCQNPLFSSWCPMREQTRTEPGTGTAMTTGSVMPEWIQNKVPEKPGVCGDDPEVGHDPGPRDPPGYAAA